MSSRPRETRSRQARFAGAIASASRQAGSAQGSFRNTGPGDRAAARILSCHREHLPRHCDCRRQCVHARGRRVGIRLGSKEGRRGGSGRPETPRHPPTHSTRAIANDPSLPLIVRVIPEHRPGPGLFRHAEQVLPGASISSTSAFRRSAVQLAPRPNPPVGVPSTSAAARTRGFYHSPRTVPSPP
jgi:hypothetical protein